jgi:hypothetical protein
MGVTSVRFNKKEEKFLTDLLLFKASSSEILLFISGCGSIISSLFIILI